MYARNVERYAVVSVQGFMSVCVIEGTMPMSSLHVFTRPLRASCW